LDKNPIFYAESASVWPTNGILTRSSVIVKLLFKHYTRAHDKKMIELFGKFACLNFGQEHGQ
jgi:hypothetical protein